MTTVTPQYKIIFFTQDDADPTMVDATYPINLPQVISYIKTFNKLPLFFYVVDSKGIKLSGKYFINGIITNGEDDMELSMIMQEKQWPQAIKWEIPSHYFPFYAGKDRNLHIV